MEFILKPKTKKAKQKIKNNGDRFVIHLDEPFCGRPAFLFKSIETGWFRWVFKKDDPLFEFEESS